jgi:hypothetical protein
LRAYGAWKDEDYDVLADGKVVVRFVSMPDLAHT